MMKARESIVMKELRRTRRKIYNDIKGMNKEEIINYFRAGADKFTRELKEFQQRMSYIKG